MQPAQPVGTGHRQHPAVAAVDQARGAGELTLLAQRIAVMASDQLVRDVGRHRTSQQGVHRHCASRQVAHVPKMAKCVRSASNPWLTSTAVTVLCTTSGPTSVTVPHRRQTRWTWSSLDAGW